MRPKDRLLAEQIAKRLEQHGIQNRMPGIRVKEDRECLIAQILESTHRVEYVRVLLGRPISPVCGDPSSRHFDPIKAAILKLREGSVDEACWLVFLFVHFGKREGSNDWAYVRRVYGSLEEPEGPWDWRRISGSPRSFRDWLQSHQRAIKDLGGGFGNHRKYVSLDARKGSGTGAAFETYVEWVLPPRSHAELFGEALRENEHNPHAAFDLLYRSMAEVASFGRVAKFDYLTMIGKLGIAGIEPRVPYLPNSTGPLAGARLLYGGSKKAALTSAVLTNALVELEELLGVGMQVLEDALCNWQKSPDLFIAFRG